MLGFGLTVAFIGIGIVFATLAFLVLVIWAITACARIVDRPKTEAGTVQKTALIETKPQEKPEQAGLSGEDDPEVIAVITAAIASVLQGPVRIATIKRLPANAASPWSSAGRTEVMSLRQF